MLKALDAELTVLQAWTPYGASLLRSRMSSDEFSDFIETSRRTEDEALSTCLVPYKDRLTNVAVELVHGEPEEAITRFIESHGIHLHAVDPGFRAAHVVTGKVVQVALAVALFVSASQPRCFSSSPWDPN